jgi:endonuclease/exonuclease/phosphatase family metal-dependent hydrolase
MKLECNKAFNQANCNLNNEHLNSNSTGTKVTIWLGDFNCHHLHWDDPSDMRLFTRALNDMELLINTVAEVGLDLVLPPGIPTHMHNITKWWTRLDHVFISKDLAKDTLDAIITCDMLPNTPGINTDYLPILTTLDFALARALQSSPRNF